MVDSGQGLAIYLHWPFCLAKCPYCDFNSHVAETVDQARWRAALLGELARSAGETKARTVTSVFFGGGTPSLIEPATVAALVDMVKELWPTADLEITLEANPTSSETARFAAFREAGINRLSLGVQSLDDGALAFLGRRHSAAGAVAAAGAAAAVFPRLSVDLIYGRPGQTAPAWRRELAEALALGGGHLSAYQLTVEPGTRFHRDGIAEADEEIAVELYQVTLEVLGNNGLPAYEVSNHARPGEECRHHLGIWRGGDYIGVGPGAHGRLSLAGGVQAIRRIGDPDSWLAAVEAEGHGTAERSVLSPGERREELLLNGLRLGEGVDRSRFRRLSGLDVEDAVDPDALARLIEGGFLTLDDSALRATAPGLRRLDSVLAALL